MAQLAIQGHSTLGKEVIALLKMLGGKNPYGCKGLGTLCAYCIIDGNIQIVTIEDLFKSNEYILYSLEGILVKFPYKVGNKVVYKHYNTTYFIRKMFWENDKILYELSDEFYSDGSSLPDTLIFDVDVTQLQPYKEETMENNNVNYCKLGKITAVCFQDTNYEDKVELQLGNDYEIKEENGKYYAVKKQSKYPKNYDECCEILNIHPRPYFTYTWNIEEVNIDKVLTRYHDNLLDKLDNLRILLICRKAYWKIAGEQMGLGKSWEYDMSKNEFSYAISYQFGHIQNIEIRHKNIILVFPTAEMRNAFYKNFKELIEACKELL